MHPWAWIAWLGSVAVFVFVVTNPLYLLLALAAVVVVHLSFPPDPSPVGRAVRTFVIAGVVLLGLRLVFVSLLTNPGRTVVVELPRFEVPRWLGAFGLGGPVTAEVLATAAIDGLRLIVLLAAFGVFNAHADTSGVLRAVPPAFRDVGLVVSIAVAFVPGMLRTVADARTAQRLRGESGWRSAPSLAVPVLGLALERALLLAESMDSRGYGRGSPARSSRALVTAGLIAMIGGLAAWAGGWRAPGSSLVVAGGVLAALSYVRASRDSGVTRLERKRVTGGDAVAIAAAIATVALVAATSAATGYDPYRVLAFPAFSLLPAAIALLVAVPAFSRTSP